MKSSRSHHNKEDPYVDEGIQFNRHITYEFIYLSSVKAHKKKHKKNTPNQSHRNNLIDEVKCSWIDIKTRQRIKIELFVIKLIKRTKITARVDEEIVRAKAHHVESTHFLIVPSNFLIPLSLFLRQVAG